MLMYGGKAMLGAGPVPAVVGCTAQAAAELSPCGKGHPLGEEGTTNPSEQRNYPAGRREPGGTQELSTGMEE